MLAIARWQVFWKGLVKGPLTPFAWPMLPEQFSKIHTSGKSARVACPSNGADATIEFFAEDSTVLDQVNDLRGNLIGSRAAFDTTCFIQNDVYDADRIPDEESFEGENEPVHYFEEETPSKHVYRDTVRCETR